MATLLFTLLFMAICGINCGTVDEKTQDFRPNGTSENNCLTKVHTDCQAAYNDGWVESGLYTISPDGTKHIDVFCEQNWGGGWTVFQRRMNGSVDFYLYWDNYTQGFGDAAGEYWLGNEYLHQLTANQDTQLLVELQDEGVTAYAQYSEFWIGNMTSNFQLHVAGFTNGPNRPGDSLTWHNGNSFSTRDRDHDTHPSTHCAQYASGAWWYTNCYSSNLNGLYNTDSGKGVFWATWKGFTSLSAVRLMVKPK